MARWLFNCSPVCGHPWRLGLATEPRERDAVFQLRYDVFVTEQGYGHAGIDAGPERDVDRFDSWCDHLFLFDDDRDRVVGTYRALCGVEAVRRGGFYASDEFDLSPLAPIAHRILQGGRACVAAEYRSTLAFQYLSYGMELLLREYDCRYFLGADSFRGDLESVCRIHSFVRHFYSEPDWKIEPWAANRVAGLHEVPVTPADERCLPEVVRMDIRLGFRVCGEPAWDPGFGCYDLLVLGRRDRFGRLYTGVVDRIERQLRAARTTLADAPPR
jgi:putative hemolysin